jgi:hypothetical protein
MKKELKVTQKRSRSRKMRWNQPKKTLNAHISVNNCRMGILFTFLFRANVYLQLFKLLLSQIVRNKWVNKQKYTNYALIFCTWTWGRGEPGHVVENDQKSTMLIAPFRYIWDIYTSINIFFIFKELVYAAEFFILTCFWKFCLNILHISSIIGHLSVISHFCLELMYISNLGLGLGWGLGLGSGLGLERNSEFSAWALTRSCAAGIYWMWYSYYTIQGADQIYMLLL